MATTTPRIGLTKPDGTDLVDIAVLNTNFDKIDSNIASTKIQSTKPTTANAGDLWWDSDTGTLYLYYTDANSSQWVAATSDPINIGVVASQAERDAQYPTPAQGMSVYRTDLGVTQRYYGLYNVSTNPGGRATAGWYDTDKNGGYIPLKATTVTAVSGTASVDSLGAVTFTTCTEIVLDGIFNAKYTNYRVEVIWVANAGSAGAAAYFLYRVGGSNTANAYYNQYVNSTGATVTGSTQSAAYQYTINPTSNNIANSTASIDCLAPYVSGWPQIRSSSTSYYSGTNYQAIGGSQHASSGGYDGFKFFIGGSGSMSGTVRVYGIVS